LVILVLALIWVAALLPPFVRSRLEGSPAESVGRFRHHLRILQSTSPAASALANAAEPETRHAEAMPVAWVNEARRLRGLRRRRQIAFGLLVSMGVTLGLGLLPPLRPLLLVNVALDGLFVGYLVLLARIRAIETEQQMVAHFSRLRAEAREQVQYDSAERAVAESGF
jgi:hypothetical protein